MRGTQKNDMRGQNHDTIPVKSLETIDRRFLKILKLKVHGVGYALNILMTLVDKNITVQNYYCNVQIFYWKAKMNYLFF